MVPDPFLRIDGFPDVERRAKLAELRRGELYIERLATQEAGKPIDVPDGLIHHWLGTVFVPGANLSQALRLMQDYDRHAEIFRPAIARSKLVSRDGDTFRVDLRFYMKKVITVVVNTENEARFTRLHPDRAQSRIYSLRIAEVEEPGTRHSLAFTLETTRRPLATSGESDPANAPEPRPTADCGEEESSSRPPSCGDSSRLFGAGE